MESCKHPNDFIALSNFLIISLSWGLRENISFPGLFAWIVIVLPSTEYLYVNPHSFFSIFFSTMESPSAIATSLNISLEQGKNSSRAK